jgi:ADP-ribose pyrophosphatase
MAPKKPDFFAPDPRLVEKRVRKNRVYEGKALDFCVDDVELPDGGKATREYLDHPGAVGVVPLLPNGDVVLVRQYRYPVEEVTLELPAGKFDKGSKESIMACVKRELREETGYTAKKFTELIEYWPTCAFANELLHLFVAEDLTPGELSPDEDEFIEKVELPFEDALALIREGKIKDSKTVIGLLAAELWVRRPRRPKRR